MDTSSKAKSFHAELSMATICNAIHSYHNENHTNIDCAQVCIVCKALSCPILLFDARLLSLQALEVTPSFGAPAGFVFPEIGSPPNSVRIRRWSDRAFERPNRTTQEIECHPKR